MLAGGRIIQMGLDQALLPAARNTLREEIDGRVRNAADVVMLSHRPHYKFLKINGFLEAIGTSEARDLRS
jgi:hypothetical protein